MFYTRLFRRGLRLVCENKLPGKQGWAIFFKTSKTGARRLFLRRKEYQMLRELVRAKDLEITTLMTATTAMSYPFAYRDELT
jgi:hypothetical protein